MSSMNGFRVAFRSPAFFAFGGVYVRLFGKWYRVIKWGER